MSNDDDDKLPSYDHSNGYDSDALEQLLQGTKEVDRSTEDHEFYGDDFDHMKPDVLHNQSGM